MKTYARIQGGVVVESIPPASYDVDSPDGVSPSFKAGDEIPITARFNVALIDGTISTMIDVTNIDPHPEQGWTYDGSEFHEPSGK